MSRQAAERSGMRIVQNNVKHAPASYAPADQLHGAPELARPLDGAGRSPAGHILLIGFEDVLLFTRKEVLRTAGYTVTCIDRKQALAQLPATRWDLAILCDSVDPESARMLALNLRRLTPERPVLRIPEMGREWDEAMIFANVVDPGAMTATALLGAVKRLLAR